MRTFITIIFILGLNLQQLRAEGNYKSDLSFANDSAINTISDFLSSLESKTKQSNVRQGGLWDAIVSFVDWLTSPFRPVWGKYEEDGMRGDFPKSLFLRGMMGNRSVTIVDKKTESEVVSTIIY